MFNNESHFGGNTFSSPNQNSKSDSAPFTKLQNVVPVCVRQVLECKSETFQMFGIKSNILSLTCILRDCEVSSTKATYKVEDHTGAITAVYWLSGDSASGGNLPPVKVGQYARIFGSPRTTEGIKHLLVMKMYPVENLNEITTHLLEVINARYGMEQLAKESGVLNKQNNPNAELANTMSNIYPDPNSDPSANITPFQRQVYRVIKNEDHTAHGISVDAIKSHFSPNQAKDVENAVASMCSEGHIYTTITSDLFKCT